VKISSKNISYQYNDKFLPLPEVSVDPHSQEHVLLTGKDLQSSPNEWNKIAGERLTLALKGIHLGERELPLKEVTFVPDNPKLRSR
jgi:hypothetical protein